jgi:hypothetical protein
MTNHPALKIIDPQTRFRRTQAQICAQVREMGKAGRERITNANTDQSEPWRLFAAPARIEGEQHRQYPSRIGERRVWLDGWHKETGA